MKIQHKFALYMFLSIIAFLMVFSLLSYWYSKDGTINSAMSAMLESVQEESNHLGDRLIEKSKIAISMASSGSVLHELIRSNAEYEQLSEKERAEKIQVLNSRWIKTENVDDDFVKSYMQNSIASSLRLQQESLEDEVGEIFITNRYGLAIGTTNKLSTLAHSHKYWWKAANNNGQGKIYFDDRGYDESVGGYVIGIVIPIMVNNQVVGILKCNFNLFPTLSRYIKSVGNHDVYESHVNGDSEVQKAILVRSSGQVIIGESATPLSEVLPDSILGKLDPSSAESMIISIDNIDHIVAYSPVSLTFSSDKYGFGGRYKYKNNTNNNDLEGWYLLFKSDLDSVLLTTIESVSWFVYAGLIFAVLAGIVALLMGRRVALPIHKLTERAKRIGKGHLNELIDSDASDELGVLTDAFNKMSIDLSESQIELMRKQRLATLGQLTATVSHELRNPLGAMRPSIYIIEKRSDKQDERVQQAIERIDRNIDRCDHIIDELLDFTRITDLELHATRLDEWLESVLDEQKIPENIRIEKNFSLRNLELDIDANRLQRAVINVVENACHAMTDEEKTDSARKDSCLCITTTENGLRIEIIISDNGVGIPENLLVKIFEPLFSTRAFGVGLGMPTVKQIMEQHGGGVELDSEVGKGTTVTLWLPVRPAEKNNGNVELSGKASLVGL
ncbi:MAG: sensor histidine kinase [Gammaproteobacteria bacterium]|nr:sensor histidine kinase [Gammaproteobacteria bacterium]